jgi:hypothetical protein
MSKLELFTHTKQCSCKFCEHYLNSSGVGNLKKTIQVSSMKNGRGVIHLQQVSHEKSSKNLKKGGREKLERNQLTSYAKRQIRDAGSMQKWLVENDADVYSSLMTTLTYGKAVPDHKTAKKHLNTFLTRCRQKNYLKHYLWVAQLQTGKRAIAKGLKSYRAENGSAIHFHILHLTYKGADLQLQNAQKEFRAIWKGIVNKWEAKAGFSVQNISGVNVIPVYNASNYVSAYVSNESDTIIGNMWNMSKEMRKEIEKTKLTIEVNKVAFEKVVRYVSAKRLSEIKEWKEFEEQKKEKIVLRKSTHHTISFPMWNGDPIIITDNTNAVLEHISLIERNNIKIKQCNAPNVIPNSHPKTNSTNTVQLRVDKAHFTPVKEAHKRPNTERKPTLQTTLIE